MEAVRLATMWEWDQDVIADLMIAKGASREEVADFERRHYETCRAELLERYGVAPYPFDTVEERENALREFNPFRAHDRGGVLGAVQPVEGGTGA